MRILAGRSPCSARSLVKRGRPAEAEPLLLEASKLLRKNYPNINVLIADVDHWLGVCLAARGQYPRPRRCSVQYKTIQASRACRRRRKPRPWTKSSTFTRPGKSPTRPRLARTQ